MSRNQEIKESLDLIVPMYEAQIDRLEKLLQLALTHLSSRNASEASQVTANVVSQQQVFQHQEEIKPDRNTFTCGNEEFTPMTDGVLDMLSEDLERSLKQ